MIRTPLSEVKIAGRNTQGVKIISLENSAKVASISIVPHEEPSNEGENEGEEVVDETLVDDNPVTPDSLDDSLKEE